MASRLELASQHFYLWERRGRGWHVFHDPVDLEPAFEPFRYYQASSAEFKDEGQLPTLCERLVNLFKAEKEPAPSIQGAVEAFPDESCKEGLNALRVIFPNEWRVTYEESEQLIIMLGNCTFPISFEITATSQRLRLQFVARESDYPYLHSQLKAYFPEAAFEEVPINQILDSQKATDVLDLGLEEEFMRPLCIPESLKLDPFTGVFGVLNQLVTGEECTVQILFKGSVEPWPESILRSVVDSEGKSFFLDAPEMPKLASEKVASPLFAVSIRVIGQAHAPNAAKRVTDMVASGLVTASASSGNKLIGLSNYEYPQASHLEDVRLRRSHRLGMLLNSKELTTFVHLPSASVVSNKFEREIKKSKAAPPSAKGNGISAGVNVHQGMESEVILSDEQRLRHVHVIGATGTGKSTLLTSLITQDIKQGNGVAVLDPHGDLIETILTQIPEHRLKDVILIDPSDPEYAIGFNILSAHSEVEKEVLSSDLVSAFRRYATSWGDQMNSVFANAILAFLESSKGGTLIDLRRFLVEKQFRNDYLSSIQDSHIQYYWAKEFPLLKTTSIGPILTRLDTFLRPKAIRYMVGQKQGLDFSSILDTRKILLIKLAQGLIGDENSYILGTTFVSKIYQAAMARQAVAKDYRSDFFLYIDEFQNFICPSMAAILSGARKYHLGMILAHQDMQQLSRNDADIANAVISNAGTRICFRLGDSDARRLAEGFSYFEAVDLQNLSVGEAIARIDRPENDFNLKITPITNPGSATIRMEAVAYSRATYGRLRSVIEKELEASVAVSQDTEPVKTLREKPIIEVQSQEIAPVEEVVTKETLLPPVSKAKNEVTKERIITEEEGAKTIERLVKQKEISRHRYLQMLIKKMAEARGYKAKIEETIPNGQGRVDVLLERDGKHIACEIGVTTTKQWEVHNVQKCLEAGYEMVAAIASDAKAKEAMQQQVSTAIDKKLQSKVLVMEAHTFFQYLDAQNAKNSTKETRLKGYRIKVEFEP